MKNIYNFSRREETQQAFRRLNLINAFIFSASTEKPENAKFIAKLIIERATGKKVGEISVTQEKTLLGIDMGSHGIYMDSSIRSIWRKPNVIHSKELCGRKSANQL